MSAIYYPGYLLARFSRDKIVHRISGYYWFANNLIGDILNFFVSNIYHLQTMNSPTMTELWKISLSIKTKKRVPQIATRRSNISIDFRRV